MAKLTTGKEFVGAAGRVTEIIPTLEPGDKAHFQATVAMWFLDCPGQSSGWRHYHLAIIHLRPIEGVKPAIIRSPGATHEVMLLALDPKPSPSPTNAKSWQYLSPYNYIGQLALPSDEEAKRGLEAMARGVADGHLWAEPPLSLQREPWDSQLRLWEAHAAGKHGQ
jgi:hypothetical protein